MESDIYKQSQLLVKIEYLNEIGDEVQKEIAMKEYLESYMKIESQLPDVVQTNRNLEMMIDICKQEENRIADRRRRAEKLSDLIKNGIKTHMINNNLDKLEIGTFQISLRKSTKLIIDNENEIPNKFCVVTTANTYPKDVIKKAIKEGEDVPGVHIETNKNLKIK